MTATDELRCPVDERGVESGYPHTLRLELHRALDAAGIDYWVAQGLTFWNCSDERECVAYGYQANGKPKLTVKIVGITDPEQAVEATLGPSDPREHGLIPHFWTGDETLHIDLGKLPERIDVTLPDPRGREVYSARVHRFEPERKECHPVVSDNLTESEGTGDAWADCSECGHLLYVLTDPSSEPPNYCPNCGAKVV